ncbi:GH32 C-terminal domain-containing protein [Vibrio sinaloensis]|nr:GH32 C-terminal domain-containing protein [Vibrio sinaloensis]
MAMPRELFLFQSKAFESKAGLRVGQRFVKELNQALSLDVQTPEPSDEQAISIYSLKEVMRFSADVTLQDSQTLHLNVYQDNPAYFEFIGVEQGVEVRSVRRGQFGTERIDQHFPHDYRVTLPIENEFQIEVLIDKGSVELLINAGQFSFTNLVYAKETQASVAVSVDSGSLALRNVQVSSLAGEKTC